MKISTWAQLGVRGKGCRKNPSQNTQIVVEILLFEYQLEDHTHYQFLVQPSKHRPRHYTPTLFWWSHVSIEKQALGNEIDPKKLLERLPLAWMDSDNLTQPDLASRCLLSLHAQNKLLIEHFFRSSSWPILPISFPSNFFVTNQAAVYN